MNQLYIYIYALFLDFLLLGHPVMAFKYSQSVCAGEEMDMRFQDLKLRESDKCERERQEDFSFLAWLSTSGGW